MSKYVLEVEELQRAMALLGYVDQKLNQLSGRITNAYNRLNGQQSDAIRNAQDAIYAQGKIYDGQWANIKYMKTVLQTIIDETARAETEAKSVMEGEWVEEPGKTDNKQIAKPSGSGSGMSGAAIPEMQKTGNVIGTVNGAPQYELPDYVLKNLEPDANGIYGNAVWHSDGTYGTVAYWNSRNEQLSCTYYTLRKLNERGLSYPCVKGPGNGANWYGNFDTTVDIPHYQGGKALEQLVGNLTLPQENIVVSFDSNTGSTAEFKAYGHVMLIDRIERNANGEVIVTYSDNYPNITTLNGTNAVQQKNLSNFMSWYNQYNGNINGVVVVGAGRK